MIESTTNAEPLIPKKEPRRRRWFQYSLRSLMVLMLLVSVGMMWLSAIKRRIDRQSAAVAAILNCGGSVVYDYQRDAQRGMARAEPPGPQWLRGLLGNNYAAEVVEVQLYAGAGEGTGGRPAHIMRPEKFTDADAELLAACSELQLLVLADTKVTDAGIKCFQGMHKLERLYIEGTLVTKAGVMELHRALPNARIISDDDEVVGPPPRRDRRSPN